MAEHRTAVIKGNIDGVHASRRALQAPSASGLFLVEFRKFLSLRKPHSRHLEGRRVLIQPASAASVTSAKVWGDPASTLFGQLV